MPIDYDLSDFEEKKITETIKDLDCSPLFVEVSADGFNMYYVRVEVLLPNSNIVAEMELEEKRGKWLCAIEILNTKEKKNVSFSSEGRLGEDAVYRVLDLILSSRKITYNLSKVT